MGTAGASRTTIWVVDDSSTDAERVRRLLAHRYAVEVLHDGSDALERIASGDLPDLLLLDWVMPGISGVEVCKYVRTLKGPAAHIPILLLTAHHGSQEIIQAFRSGANDYISKPFIDEELLSRVSTLLESKSLLRRAEKAESEILNLLETAPDPIYAVQADGTISFVNEEGLAVLGYRRDEVLGRPFPEVVPGLDLARFTKRAGGSQLPVPDVHLGKRVFSPSVRILPSDRTNTVTVALRDVTARRKTEARRLDFYSIIAHDLRTPITAVILRFQMAFRGKHGVLPASLLEDLTRAEKNLKSLLGLINDFLELARLEGVGFNLAREPINIVDLFRSTLEDFEPLLDKHSLSWNSVGFDRECRVVGDSQRLAQVLSNLIGNAIKFTPKEGSITGSVSMDEDHVEISIEDTGRGIEPDRIPTLFERFTRGEASESDAPGTGLGLMIVKEIVEAHGGIIGVESVLGTGSRFWFKLPRATQA
jgi:two-component system phosphate regulon sensor histidine kinase PhoR